MPGNEQLQISSPPISATEYFPARALQRTVDKGPMNPGPRYYILE